MYDLFAGDSEPIVFAPRARTSLIPRDYQQSAIEESFRLWKQGHIGVMCRIPTGGGKTFTGTSIADLWNQQGDNYRTLVMCHERQLIDQFAQDIEDILHARPAIEMGSVHCKGNEPLIVASRQTLYVKRDINGEQSRLFKFRPDLNWLLIIDEAHRYTRHLKIVKPIIEWFEQNTNHRRLLLTATPERTDKISFEGLATGISSDYMLYDVDGGPSAVNDGWAVPYDQRYIVVDGVNFDSIPTDKGDFDPNELERILSEQSPLAAVCDPLLDIVGKRRTLIFSPTKAMAKAVALYINAKLEMTAAKSLDGDHPDYVRKSVFREHQSGAFQFLSICMLCIAKGSRILTDAGEVPIEDVTTDMKVWDGVEFVSHGGVICKGVQPVIRYAGLTATENHNVWTNRGWKTLADCKKSGLAISVSGIEGRPVRESDDYYRTHDTPRKSTATASRSNVQQVWGDVDENVLPASQGRVGVPCVRGQGVTAESLQGAGCNSRNGGNYCLRETEDHRRDHSSHWKWIRFAGRIERAVHRLWKGVSQTIERTIRRSVRVQELLEEERNTAVVAVPMQGSKAAMHEQAECGLSGLWRERDSVPIRVHTGDGSLGHCQLGASSRVDARQNRESGSLPSGESEVCNTDNSSQQPEAETAEVYDILNAGPRSRFTANGLIVSNCREGYNDPDIAAVAIFRITKSRSLKEQMCGRGCRPMRGTVSSEMTREERRKAIAESAKTHCLIVDLTGATGLGDVPSTVDILAASKPDDVRALANKKIQAKKPDERSDVQQAIKDAENEIAEDRRLAREAKLKREQDEADRRAKLKAKVSYTEHKVRSGQAGKSHRKQKHANPPSVGMCKYLYALGVNNPESMSMNQAKGFLNQVSKKHGQDYIVRGGEHRGKALKDIPHPELKALAQQRNSGSDYDREFQSQVALYRRQWLEAQKPKQNNGFD